MRRDNLVVHQGTSWEVSWRVNNPETRQPIGNFDGWSARAHVRRYVADTAPLFSWSSAPEDDEGSITLADGKVTLSLEPAQSSPWLWRDGIFSVEVTNPEGDVILISTGKFKVIPEVTR